VDLVITRDRVIEGLTRPFAAIILANLKEEILPRIFADTRGSERMRILLEPASASAGIRARASAVP
jgi:hypothetical protein